MPPPISICIAAKNEQAKIGHALASARACPWCDELLVFDSGSTDRTLDIAREAADRVEHHEWVDYTTSKRRMSEAARHDWVFILDADEQITPELSDAIARLPDSAFDAHPVISMPRRNYLLGRHVRAWGPDPQTRLIDRRRVRWPERAVHDAREPTEGSTLRLAAPLLHNPAADDWSDYFDGRRYDARTEALAREMLAAGKRARLIDLWLRPAAAFFKLYIVKRGFLDGAIGLLAAQKTAFSTQLKYARLWHLQNPARPGPPADERA